MGSEKAAERDQITLELWEAGRDALPIVEKLAESRDPEISQRALTIFHRLRMGLRPDSPANLLALANQLEIAPPDLRAKGLEDLLEHPLGVPVALAILDLWSQEDFTTPDEFSNWASIVADDLIEQRSYWREFLTGPLTPRSRGTLVWIIGNEAIPMKNLMIEHLAIKETRKVFEVARTCPGELSGIAIESMARAALAGKDAELALEILFSSLPESPDGQLVRQIAFVESLAQIEPRPYQGKWGNHLDLFRQRAKGNLDQAEELASRIAGIDPLLTYETRILAGEFAIPSDDLPLDSLAETLMKALGHSFGKTPSEPDIEDLASTVTNDGIRLARGLLLLGHPAESGQVLADQRQPELAIRTLWMTGHRDEARRIAGEFIEHGDKKEQISIRLVFTQLLGRSGLLEEARQIFEPLFEQEIRFDHLRREAVRLALLLYPREDVLKLVPELSQGSKFARQLAISTLLKFPAPVSSYCYEEMRAEHPDLSPAEILAKVEEHLSQPREVLIDHYGNLLAGIGVKHFRTIAPEFHLALFLHHQDAADMVVRDAWYRLSTDEIESFSRGDTWPDLIPLMREQGAQVSPGSAYFRTFDEDFNTPGDIDWPALLTLGDSFELAKLPISKAHLVAAELSNLTKAHDLKLLRDTGTWSLENGGAGEAARYLQAGLIGDLILGTQPGTPFGELVESRQSYLQARAKSAGDPAIGGLWQARMEDWALPAD